jgi:hypothetical protein
MLAESASNSTPAKIFDFSLVKLQPRITGCIFHKTSIRPEFINFTMSARLAKPIQRFNLKTPYFTQLISSAA